VTNENRMMDGAFSIRYAYDCP